MLPADDESISRHYYFVNASLEMALTWNSAAVDGAVGLDPAPVGQPRGGSRRRPPSAHCIVDTVFVRSSTNEDNEIQGAKRGATAYSLQATLSLCQPSSTQLEPTSGDVRPPPGTHQRCRLLSRRQRLRDTGMLTLAETAAAHGVRNHTI
jgi:hypothetical protein